MTVLMEVFQGDDWYRPACFACAWRGPLFSTAAEANRWVTPHLKDCPAPEEGENNALD